MGHGLSLVKQKGFTLIEILVAMAIIALVLGVVVGNIGTESEDTLNDSVQYFERSLRFSVDESALRNAVVRLHFQLDKNPAEFNIEYGPDEDFVLPSVKVSLVQSLEEARAIKARNKKLNQQFNRIKEFEKQNKIFPEEVRIIGVGTSTSEKLITEGEVSLYVFPTGEKDDGIIVLATESVVTGLSFNPFNNDFSTIRKSMEGDGEDPYEEQVELAREIYGEWLK
jgi:prepilin-type N-terminal cleavage/methylation domain-containing protein